MTDTDAVQQAHAQKKIRQSDVAQSAGVSPSTVSKVLNNSSGISQEVRDRVMQAMHELGYPELPQRKKNKGKAPLRRIKVVTYFQFLVRETSYFHSEIMHSVLAECDKQGLLIDTVLLSRDEPNDLNIYRARMNEGDADAILFVGIDTPELLEVARKLGIPTLILNGNDPECAFDSISPGVLDGSRLVTRHLIEQGHRNIIHVTHLYRPFIHQRLAGFRQALEEADLPYSPEENLINVDYAPAFSADKASEAVYTRIMSGQLKATAFFCVTDYTAFGVIQAILRAGRRVPEDFSVVSFDDLPLAQFSHPPITSAGVDREALGRMGVQHILDRLQNPSNPVLRIELCPHLSVRASVRKLP